MSPTCRSRQSYRNSKVSRLKESFASAGLALCCLVLLMAVATTLLACGPAAQTAPAGDVILPAAQVSGGGEPTAEPEDDTDTPTGEPEEVADTPTPIPTVCVQWESTEERIEYCFTPEPKVTPKYPNLSDHRLVELVEEFEKAQQSVSGSTGQTVDAGNTLIEIWIYLSSDKVESLAAWLENNSVSDFEKWDDAIHVWVPVSLLGPLSQQSGVRSVEMPREGVPAVIW